MDLFHRTKDIIDMKHMSGYKICKEHSKSEALFSMGSVLASASGVE